MIVIKEFDLVQLDSINPSHYEHMALHPNALQAGGKMFLPKKDYLYQLQVLLVLEKKSKTLTHKCK